MTILQQYYELVQKFTEQQNEMKYCILKYMEVVQGIRLCY